MAIFRDSKRNNPSEMGMLGGGGIFAYGEPGGGIFAKTTKTPPLQSAMRGWHCVSYCAPNIAHFSLVAMRIPCTPHAAHLWGIYGFHNDAARRGVIWPSCLSPMGTYGLYHGTTLVREGTRGWAGNSRPSPTAPPLPRTKWPISPIDRNVIPCCKLHINNAALSGLYASHLKRPYVFYNDAACRIVTLPFAVPVDAHVVANGGRRRCVATESPQMPTVGAGSSQREDSPAHHLAMRIPCQPRIAPINGRPHGLCSDVARRVAAQNRQAASLIVPRRVPELQSAP